MNTPAKRPFLALVACFAAVALQPLHAAPPQSSKAFFMGDSTPHSPASNALNPASWSGGVLPKETDDVVIQDDYVYSNRPGTLVRMKSLLSERGSQLFFARASLSVAEDAKLGSGIEFQFGRDTLAVGGDLFVEWGFLSFVGGLAEGTKGEPAPRFTGNSLSVAFGAGIRLRLFRDVPQGIPGNTVPYIRLSGDARFALSTSVIISLEEGAPGLSPGEYLLLTAGGAIKGPLPELTIRNEPPGAKTKSELKLSPDNRKLLIVVTDAK